ncbi:MAG: hypothetical protein MJZ29_05455 [Bacteroidaceae bacterium]|nr:hypothetical protein [Bacteroidaceae bacterium]
MKILAIIGTAVGTLVFAFLFDRICMKIDRFFRKKKDGHTIEDFRDIVDKI